MQVSRPEIYTRIIPHVKNLVDDWELDDWDEEISEETQLIEDLGLTSVEFVDLFVAIEKDFGRTIGFHELLMVDGKYISDLSLGGLTEYLFEKINATVVQTNTVRTTDSPKPQDVPKLNADTLARFKGIVPKLDELPPPERKNRKMLFLLSAPRSGSTLLQVMLAGHPRLFAPPELHLLWFEDFRQRSMVYSFDSNKHLVSGTIRAMMELDGLTVEQATEFMRQIEDQGMSTRDFYQLLQDRLGDRLLVDKTPSYAYTNDTLKRAESDFDDPLYIHLVRHPCGMVRSFTDAKLERTVPFMWRHGSDFSGHEFAELAWLVCNKNISEFLSNVPANRHFRLYYEELVTHPKEVMEGLCRYLNLEFHKDMLDPYGDKTKRMADGVGSVSQLSGDLKFHLHGRIDPEGANRWQKFFTEDSVSDITWEFAETLGYRRDGRGIGPRTSAVD